MNQQKKQPYFAFKIKYHPIARVIYSDILIDMPSAITGEKKEWTKFKAIWDTGATNSVISNKVISQLSLVPTGKTDVSTVGGIFNKNTFIVDIGLPNGLFFKDVVVTEADIGEKYDVLVGMDIISMGDFSISNKPNNTIFTFCFPPLPTTKNVDLLKIANELNKKEFNKAMKYKKKRIRRKKSK